MSKIEMLRVLVNERLQIATEEVFRIVERTIVDYEEEASHFKKVIDYQRRLLATHNTLKAAAEPIQFSVCEAKVAPEQQHCELEQSPSLDQNTEHPQIKEEPGELWTNQEREQLEGLEEGVDTKDYKFTITCVTSKHNLSKTQSAQSYPPVPSTSAEPLGELCGEGEPTSDCHPLFSNHSGAESEDAHNESRGLLSASMRWNSNKMVRSEGDSSLSKKSTLLSDLNSQIQTANCSCKICGIHFPQHSCLIKHAHTHAGDPKCICAVCGNQFASAKSLLEHIRIHSSLQRNPGDLYSSTVCHYCGKMLGTRQLLAEHVRTHTGERRHGCDFCGRSFSRHSNMLLHRRCHTGEKPYSCSLCDKRFSDRSTMNMHKRVHTGEKPYQCSFCEKRFSQSAHLKRHSKAHTM